MGGLLHLVQRGWAWAGCGPTQSPSLCTKCNINGLCTNHCLLYDGPLLCGFNVAIKGLITTVSNSHHMNFGQTVAVRDYSIVLS